MTEMTAMVIETGTKDRPTGMVKLLRQLRGSPQCPR